ncbi:hypothetical protein ACFFIX_16900 [Metabacillus herbersteinensis]|uniref:Plasmid segregation centromere-binding protein ParR n=1 Tax=Metabacillus herbersteinensis TaxID=283816 RepID=A0ABV6GHD0_9BACI
MIKKGMTGIQRGQAITFRLPSDTPDHILRQLQKLKDTERRNFSSKIAEFVVEGVSNSLSKEREIVTVPLPKQLSKEQRNWLKHAHSEALLGSIVYQLLADPIRATSVLASLNSNALDINEALYLQEFEQVNYLEDHYTENETTIKNDGEETQENSTEQAELEDDLMNFDWNKAKEEQASSIEDNQEDEQEDDRENLLGDFLAQMNK